MNIYVGNLAYNVTEDDLTTMFSQYGEVESVKLIIDNYTRQSKGFAFVEMPSNSEADQAIKALNGSTFKERNIKVNQSNPSGRKTKSRRRY